MRSSATTGLYGAHGSVVNVGVWHLADKPTASEFVRCWGIADMAKAAAMSACDPQWTFLVRATNLAALHRWAWNWPVRTENAAIARQWLKSFSACLTVIKELADVSRHCLRSGVAALGTGDSGLFHHNLGSLVCTMASRICIASAVPSASPFSKSWAVCPMVLVTWAIHRTLAWRALANA